MNQLEQMLAPRELDIIQVRNKNSGLFQYKNNSASSQSPEKPRSEQNQTQPLANNLFQNRNQYQMRKVRKQLRGGSMERTEERLNATEKNYLPYVTTYSEYGGNPLQNKNSRLRSAYDLTKIPTKRETNDANPEETVPDSHKFKDNINNASALAGIADRQSRNKSQNNIDRRERRSLTENKVNNKSTVILDNQPQPNESDLASSAGKFFSNKQNDLPAVEVSASENCFSMDYSFLENISPSDPRLQRVLNEEFLNSKNIDLEGILEKNSEYFHHLFSNCACSKCKCGRCRCAFANLKLNYKNGFNSIYKKDFIGKNEAEKKYITPPLFQTKYDTLAEVRKEQQVFDPSHTTTNKHDYDEKQLPIKQRPPDYAPNKLPFMSMTTYGQSFKDWKDYDPNWVFSRPKLQSTVGEKVPMDCKTIYNMTYEKDVRRKKIVNADVEEVKRLQKDCPIPQVYKEDASSTYSKRFQNYNIKDIPTTYMPVKYMTQTERSDPIPSWNGQFISTAQKSFQGTQDQLCPSTLNNITRPWKIKLLSKMRNTQGKQSPASPLNQLQY